MKNIKKIIATVIIFNILNCQAQKEIWYIGEKVIEYDTLFTKNGDIKKINERVYWDSVPIRLVDTIESEERLNKYGGFIYVEGQTVSSLLKKYNLPTEREVAAIQQLTIENELDKILFITEVNPYSTVWMRKETIVQQVLPKQYIVEENYEKYISPREGYTRIVEKTKVISPNCIVRYKEKSIGLLVQNVIKLEEQVSGWIFVTAKTRS